MEKPQNLFPTVLKIHLHLAVRVLMKYKYFLHFRGILIG